MSTTRSVLLNSVVRLAGGPNGGSLNGVQSQAYLRETLDAALKTSQSVSVLIVSIDYLQDMYDAKGMTAQRVYEEIAKLLRRAAPAGVFSWSAGREFAIVVEGEKALDTAEAIRADVENSRFDFWPELRATVSIGVAISTPDRQTGPLLTSAADLALLNGLGRGRLYGEIGSERNRVFIARG